MPRLNKKTDPRYKSISGYIPVEMLERIKEVMQETGLDQNEALESAFKTWLGDADEAKDIKELVSKNYETLKEKGFSEAKLNQIKDGEMLPTTPDFARIIELLDLEEYKARRVWNATYSREFENERDKSSQ